MFIHQHPCCDWVERVPLLSCVLSSFLTCSASVVTQVEEAVMAYMLLGAWWFWVNWNAISKRQIAHRQVITSCHMGPTKPPGPAMAQHSIQTCLWSNILAFPVTFWLFATVPKCHFYYQEKLTQLHGWLPMHLSCKITLLNLCECVVH